MKTHSTFFFESFSFEKESQTLFLEYSYGKDLSFTETIQFHGDLKNVSHKGFQKACQNLWIMCGISYFKAFLPETIEIKNNFLDTQSAEFFTNVYTHGLGEFFYMNNISPKGKINFPISKNTEKSQEFFPDLAGSLLPIGGGKDSLVSAFLLSRSNEEWTPWIVNPTPLQKNSCEIFRKEPLAITRKIDPKLFELNAQGALNGHIPISAILAFLGVCSAILTGKKNIILSNESSANEENTIFHEIPINHQYSKSLEFEKAFQKHIHKNISPDIQYFSLLRPWSELKIAEVFATHIWTKAKDIFSSCNTNFRVHKDKPSDLWCSECPKCAFVFLILAPFVPKSELIQLFGENLFQKKSQEKTFRALLGLEDHKPFECVGETQECREALIRCSGEFPETAPLINALKSQEKFDINTLHEHSMPQKLYSYIQSHTS